MKKNKGARPKATRIPLKRSAAKKPVPSVRRPGAASRGETGSARSGARRPLVTHFGEDHGARGAARTVSRDRALQTRAFARFGRP